MEKVYINNVDITDMITSFEVYEEMDKDLIIGSSVSTQIKLKLKNRDNQLEGMLDHPFLIGDKTYLVYDKPEKWTNSVSVTLYDQMILSNVPYDTRLVYPATISNQLDEMSQIIGIMIDKTTLSSQLLSKEVNWYDNTMIIRNYLGFIAQCDGKNAFIENDRIVFRSLAFATHDTDFCSDYELNELMTFSRVCYDDGLNILSKGDKTGKTLYVSSNNLYIEQSDIDRIYSLYNGLYFYSFKKFKCKDMGIKLTDLLSYGDITVMPLSIKRKVYGGEASDAIEMSADITIKNMDSVIIHDDPLSRIKHIQTIVNQNEAELHIVANEQENIKNDVGNIEKRINKAEIKLKPENIYLAVEKNFNELQSLYSKINMLYDTLQMQVTNLSNTNSISSASDFANYMEEYNPGLRLYPSSEWFDYALCSNMLFCNDTLICGTATYSQHLNEVFKNSVYNTYYIFEYVNGLYKWRQLTSDEIENMSDIYNAVVVDKDKVRIVSSKAGKSNSIEVSYEKGIKMTGNIYCC